jgi:hypothetical protein
LAVLAARLDDTAGCSAQLRTDTACCDLSFQPTPALLKPPSVGPMRSSVSIRPNLSCFWMMPVFRAALASVSKQPKNPPFWIAPLSGSTRRPGILPAEAPFVHTPRFGIETVHPAVADSTLPLQLPQFLKTCLLKRACGD